MSGHPPHVLFATAELEPIVKVGGLGEAAAGLVGALRALGANVEVVVPDYGSAPLSNQSETVLDVPDWVGVAVARTGFLRGFGEVTLLRVDGIARPHPYVEPHTGRAWPDNDRRFLAFSAAVGALACARRPDVVHLNDWHTAAASAFLPPDLPCVLSIHNLAYQGQTDRSWLGHLGDSAWAFDQWGQMNPLAGGIRLANRIIAVSPTYAAEMLTETHGAGLQSILAGRGSAVLGIRNGINNAVWDPQHDDHLPVTYGTSNLTGKDLCRKYLLTRTTIEADDGPVLGFVGRFVDQKGVDLVLELARFLDRIPARLVLIGEGEADLVAKAARIASEHSDRMFFFARYREDLSHQIIAGSDILLVPSRFEPCGLVQMQAMAYGTIPVATAVGGLKDTIVDADERPATGNGFLAARAEVTDVVEAVHRATRAWSDRRRRQVICRRGMRTDWSWSIPAARYLEQYRELL